MGKSLARKGKKKIYILSKERTMSDESTQETPEPMKDQTPPGTPWPNPNRTTDADDGPSPIGNNERIRRQ
jgi:hypothetical protein